MDVNRVNRVNRISSNPLTVARTRERVALTTEAARRANVYVGSAVHRSIAPTEQAVAALEVFRRPLQDGSVPAREVLRQLDTYGSPATVVQHQGRFFGYVNGGVEPAAAAAAILSGAWDQNVGLPTMSPAAAVLDEVAAQWIVSLLGLPAQSVATFTTGATLANFTAICAARDALLARVGWDVHEKGLFAAPPIRVIASDEIHASVLKSLRMAGIGPGSIERVPTDAIGAVRADQFPQDTNELTLVLLQAGNVNTGHSDPFAEIIPGVRSRGGWVHVDGAFGLWAAASPSKRALVRGVELADSWATDAHKWLNAPYDSGVVIVRERDHLARAMTIDAAYVATTADRPLIHLSPHMSQRARGVDTWALLATLGRDGVARLIDTTCDHAAAFAAALSEAGATVLAPVALNQVVVAFPGPHGATDDTTTDDAVTDDAVTDAVVAAVQKEGTMWAGGTTWKGRRAMRISVSDAATTSDHVDASVEAIVRSWHLVLGSVQPH